MSKEERTIPSEKILFAQIICFSDKQKNYSEKITFSKRFWSRKSKTNILCKLWRVRKMIQKQRVENLKSFWRIQRNCSNEWNYRTEKRKFQIMRSFNQIYGLGSAILFTAVYSFASLCNFLMLHYILRHRMKTYDMAGDLKIEPEPVVDWWAPAKRGCNGDYRHVMFHVIGIKSPIIIGT